MIGPIVPSLSCTLRRLLRFPLPAAPGSTTPGTSLIDLSPKNRLGVWNPGSIVSSVSSDPKTSKTTASLRFRDRPLVGLCSPPTAENKSKEQPDPKSPVFFFVLSCHPRKRRKARKEGRTPLRCEMHLHLPCPPGGCGKCRRPALPVAERKKKYSHSVRRPNWRRQRAPYWEARLGRGTDRGEEGTALYINGSQRRRRQLATCPTLETLLCCGGPLWFPPFAPLSQVAGFLV